MKFADVYVAYPLEESFTYRIPPEMKILPGMRVRVNFSGRDVMAYVHRVHSTEPGGFELKDIIDMADPEPIFDHRLIDLAEFISASYISSVGEALSMALPSGLRPSDRYKIPFEKGEDKAIALNEGQQEIFDSILSGYEKGRAAHLIFGITGSGKTEIYIEIARRMKEQGKSVIYLVPEISLTSQTFERLYRVFGDQLVVYHSHLTANQRLHNWIRFYKGDAMIAVGTRSAVFLQCPDLGMIIIDEEHDGSYKEHSTPRYSARRVAFYRSRIEGALLIMGSATPSFESLYAVEKGILTGHTLAARYGGAQLPEIEIVKMESGRADRLISTPLKLQTKRAIDKGKQVIYLLNRRGFAPLLICDDCGWVALCPDCSISMNYHRGGTLICHYCGLKKGVPQVCGQCDSEDLVKVGTGTQRVEEIVGGEFPDYRIFRLDQDTSRKKDAVPDLIRKMEEGDVDILIGTQLVAKGFDFRNITVVGVLLADIGMNLPDFRASERIFSLLVQVSGRSGRGKYPGKVIIQTLNAERQLFTFIKNHDYHGFYKAELEVRRLLKYPPFSHLARLLVRGRDEGKVKDNIDRLRKALIKVIEKDKMDISLLGPASAPFSKIGGSYRHHIILKSPDVTLLRQAILASRSAVLGRDVYLEVDIDPYDLL